MRTLQIILRTLRGEGQVALFTGLIAFGITRLLTPATATMAAAAFGVTAGLIAAALDTYYFHLLFLLQEARVRAAEVRYGRELEDARARLLDGSMRLREALIRRFEEDYRRTRATHSGSETKRQLREAKARLKSRLWTVERVLTGSQLVEATAEAKTDPGLLERWTERVDGLVDAKMQVQRRQTFPASLLNRLSPARFARQILAEWQGLTNAG